MEDLCLCGSGQKYASCCRPWHEGAATPSVEVLMRARYSAYALSLVDYILKTTHPENQDSKRPIKERKKEIEQFCKKTLFKGLKILEVGKDTVKFIVHLSQEGKDFSFTETSTFQTVGKSWLYLRGEFD